MPNQSFLINAVQRNLAWFERSGIMTPSDGSWGVGERLLTSADAELQGKITEVFGCVSVGTACRIVESRRTDCNFQLLLLYLQAYDKLQIGHYRQIAENLAQFLYCRSGLLARNSNLPPLGVWNWSHAEWNRTLWFDDNSWAAIAQFILRRTHPELAAQFDLKSWSGLLCRELHTAFLRTSRNPCHGSDPDMLDPEQLWHGRLYLPHWGALVCLALTAADACNRTREYREDIEVYFQSLKPDGLNNSECCYALLCSTVAAALYGGDLLRSIVTQVGTLLIGKITRETGNLAAQHYEAPSGADLVDTIYTMNWLPAALQNYVHLTGDSEANALKEKVFQLLLDIQECNSSPEFDGCWRGMYDLRLKRWGGGERIEGGAASIYSGWTNAPIALWLLLESQHESLLTLILGNRED